MTIATTTPYKLGSLWRTRRKILGKTIEGRLHQIPYGAIVLLVGHKEDPIDPFNDGDFIFLWDDKILLIIEKLDVGHDFNFNPTPDDDDYIAEEVE